MVRRPRPLLRAAMLGGIGFASYQAGRRGAELAQHESPPAPSIRRLRALSMLQELLDSGVLTRQEFDAARQRIPPL